MKSYTPTEAHERDAWMSGDTMTDPDMAEFVRQAEDPTYRRTVASRRAARRAACDVTREAARRAIRAAAPPDPDPCSVCPRRGTCPDF